MTCLLAVIVRLSTCDRCQNLTQERSWVGRVSLTTLEVAGNIFVLETFLGQAFEVHQMLRKFQAVVVIERVTWQVHAIV